MRLLSPEGVLTTSIRFGSGVDGWRRDRLYVMNRAGGMFEVFVGVDGVAAYHWPEER